MNFFQAMQSFFANRNVAFLTKISFNRRVHLLDIGARDGVGWPWKTAPDNILDIVLVEPDPVEAKILEKQTQGKIIPHALWDKETELTLNINNSPGTRRYLSQTCHFYSNLMMLSALWRKIELAYKQKLWMVWHKITKLM